MNTFIAMSKYLHPLSVLFLWLLVSSVPLSARTIDYDFCKDGVYYVYGDRFYTIHSFSVPGESDLLNKLFVTQGETPYDDNLIIPAEVETPEGDMVRVVGIEYLGSSDMTSLTIPESIKIVDTDAFGGLRNLKELNWNVSALEEFGYLPRYRPDIWPFASGSVMPKSLERVNIGENVYSLPQFFLNGCGNIESLVIPKRVQRIYGSALAGPRKIEFKNMDSIHFYDSTDEVFCAYGYSNENYVDGYRIPYYLEEVKLSGNTIDFPSLSIPKKVIINGWYIPQLTGPGISEIEVCTKVSILKPMVGLSNVKTLSLPKGGYEEICDYAFYDSGIEEVELGSMSYGPTMTRIGKHWLPDVLKKISFTPDARIINGCADQMLIKEVTIPGQTEKIMGGAFENCISLKDIIFESREKILSIKEGAFKGCISLERLSLPTGHYEFYPNAFEDCESLKSISFTEQANVTPYETLYYPWPESLTDIYCYSVKPIELDLKTAESDGFLKKGDPLYGKLTIHVPKGTIEAYRDKHCWSKFPNIVDDLDNPLASEEDVTEDETSLSGNAQVRIFDCTGAQVYAGKYSEASLPSGAMYIVKNGNKSFKIIK